MSNFDFIEDEELRAKAIEAADSEIKEMKESLNQSVQEQINEAVAGLKAKNEELIGEKRRIQEVLKNFEDIDPKKAREALQFLENNEDAQLIKDGKIDELIEKRTSQLRSDYEKQLEELQTILGEHSKKAETYESLYKSKVIEDTLREVALSAKVRSEAVSDILLRGKMIFQLGEDGSLEARDNDGNLVKTEDGKILTPTNWIESLKSDAPHYWPQSEGAGFHGKGGNVGDSNAALIRAAEKGDMKEYRRLREKQRMAGV